MNGRQARAHRRVLRRPDQHERDQRYFRTHPKTRWRVRRIAASEREFPSAYSHLLVVYDRARDTWHGKPLVADDDAVAWALGALVIAALEDAA